MCPLMAAVQNEISETRRLRIFSRVHRDVLRVERLHQGRQRVRHHFDAERKRLSNCRNPIAEQACRKQFDPALIHRLQPAEVSLAEVVDQVVAGAPSEH